MITQLKNFFKSRFPKGYIRLCCILLYPYNKWKKHQKNKQYLQQIEESSEYHKKALLKLIGKERINCVFLALFDSVWKYDNVYRLMEKDTRFNPIILVCPIVNYGKENMYENMETSYNTFKGKGYHVIRSYCIETDEYLDLRKELKPDIIFYTNPYRGLIDDRYYIDNFKDILTVYTPYFFCTNKDFHLSFNEPLHNLVWRRYLETEIHKQYAEKYSLNKGRNVVVTGAPGIDDLINPNYHSLDVWQDKTHKKKRIIWAPHHTITPVGVIFYSCFLKYADFLLDLAKKYEESVEICFKPHPILRNRLYLVWGKEKTDDYYNQWNTGCNTSLSEGQYMDLFLTSDAMLHDSASFIVEYLYTGKPVLRTLNGQDLKEQFSEFGLSCLDCHYKSNNEEDIEQFIQNVINGVDPMKEQRTKFVNEVLMPKGGMASQNIINDIIDSIEHQRV